MGFSQRVGNGLREALVGTRALHLEASTALRYARVRPFMVRGDIRTLNVGTGGGVETLELLRRGNRVTTLELEPEAIRRTRWRVELSGFADRHDTLMGHIQDVDLTGEYQQILMLEVLEHLSDDFGALKKLASHLAPGGRLILSTPTASWGQLAIDHVVPEETGEGHVRVGYDGPELDVMLDQLGLMTLRRTYNTFVLMRAVLRCERWLRLRRATLPLGLAFSLACRPLAGLLELIRSRPLDQITLAVKTHKSAEYSP